MPVIVILLLSIIYGNKPAFDGASYTFLEQSFSAVFTFAICVDGLMGLPLVVSDYRNRKILKQYKVTPISPVMILLVQITIYILYSLVSLALIYIVASLFFDFKMFSSVGIFFLSYILVMLSMFSIGMMVEV